MKFNKLDTVRVISGNFNGQTGQVVGYSQIHRNSVPDMAEYQVTFRDLNTTEEFKEDFLILVEAFDPVKAEKERQGKIEAAKAEAERIADEKMTEALRKKIEKELTLRDQIEKEFAAKKLLEALATPQEKTSTTE